MKLVKLIGDDVDALLEKINAARLAEYVIGVVIHPSGVAAVLRLSDQMAKVIIAATVAEAEKPAPLFARVCQGMNCGCSDGMSHSLECHAEHAAAIAGGRFVRMRSFVRMRIKTPTRCAGQKYENASRYRHILLLVLQCATDARTGQR